MKKNTELPEKAVRMQTLKEIVLMAFYTGEYRDPGFREEVNDIADYVMAEEIAQIKMIAEYERAFIRQEAEILKLKTMQEIERNVSEIYRKLEEDIREIYNNAARKIQEDTLAQMQSKVDEYDEKIKALETNPQLVAPEAYEQTIMNERQSYRRMGRFFKQVIDSVKPKL